MAEPSSDSRNVARRFTGLTVLQRRQTHESPESLRGPLGLRLQFEPKDALVELIFVHGFPGGSRRSWSYNEDSATFWPKEWLPAEPAFANIRVYTFGYDLAGADRRVDVARIQPLGRSLLDSVANDIHIRKNDTNPIIFVAHSLGGQVVKQAFNDAKSSTVYKTLAYRIHSLFFLSTPHQGLDQESMVLNILRACNPEPRPPNLELYPNFAVIENINREFQHHHDGSSHLHSFYELQSVPGSKSVAVDRNAAALPFANVEPVPLMADHRGVARFETATDPAYMTIRAHLEQTSADIIADLRDPEKVLNDMRLLADYLGINGSEAEEGLAFHTPTPGSCTWLTSSEQFKEWLGTSHSSVEERRGGLARNTQQFQPSQGSRGIQRPSRRFFWLSGAAGSGKSVLATHVIQHMIEEQQLNCSYYFLKSKQHIGHLLRSMAYQMAGRDLALRQSLLAMQQEEAFNADLTDVRAIWKQLFLQKIFKTGIIQKQVWVIDALDEGTGSQDFIDLVSKLPAQLPLKVFVSSRRDFQMERLFRNLPTITHNITPADSLPDIKTFLEANKYSLHLDEAGIEDLINQMLHKSQGSFLWTCLVLQRLEHVWDDEAVQDVLKEVPEGMNDLYHLILEEMSERKNELLAKAILRWTICTARPLTVMELQEAILRDTGSRVRVMDKMIEDVCGQLVIVGKNGKVQLVHDTARDFLLNPRLESNFAIPKAESHSILAKVCLRHLNESDGKHITGSQTISPLHEYTHLYFSHHVVRSRPADSNPNSDQIDAETTSGLIDFLSTNSILRWIEFVAELGDLKVLTETAKNLKSWVDHRRDYQSALDKDLKFVQGWAVDLIRLVTVFGKHLLMTPSCVHTVIPPLSPIASNIYQRFGRSHLGLEVVGLSARGWADRIFSDPFYDNWTISVACSETRYAVGLRSGTVILYYSSTCERSGVEINHGEAVKHLEFSALHRWLLTTGLHRMSLWDYEMGEQIWSVSVSSEAMALKFFEQDSVIISATRSGHLVYRNASDGMETRSISWHTTRVRQPMKVVMSTELNLVAILYRNQPILLLDLAYPGRPRYLGGQSTVLAFAFNGAQRVVAVSYFHGELCVYNLADIEKETEIIANIHHMAASIDGKTLLAGDKAGNIHIYEFESLKPIHTVCAQDDELMSLVFAPNSLRFLDVRRKTFNVWEPTSLVRRKDNDDSTSQGNTSFSTAPSELVQAYVEMDPSPITALAVHDQGQHVFCGKENGSVSVYDLSRGKVLKLLLDHGTVSVDALEWNAAESILISSDRSSLVKAHRVQQFQERGPLRTQTKWKATFLFERRVDAPIRQILSAVSGEYILISDHTGDVLWTLGGHDVLAHRCHHVEPSKTAPQRWASHPRFKRRLFEIHSHGVHILEWVQAHPPSEPTEVSTVEKVDLNARISGVHFINFAENLWAAYTDSPFSKPLVWRAAPSENRAMAFQQAVEHFKSAAPEIQFLIGLYQSQLVFMDTNSWICSMSINERGQERSHLRHFPIPHCWQSSSRRVVATVSSKGDVILIKGDELAIVKSGLSLSAG